MKTRVRVLSALLVVLMLLSAAPVVPAAKAVDKQSLYLSYYATVLNQYKDVVNHNYYRNSYNTPEMPKYVPEELIYTKIENPDNNLYYAFYDLDKNGIPELIVADVFRDGVPWEYYYGVYTFFNKKIQRLGNNQGRYYRSTGTVHSTGVFVLHDSYEYTYHEWNFYKISSKTGKRVFADRIVATCDPADVNMKFSYTRGAKQTTKITEAKAKQICKNYTGQKNLFNLKSNVKLTWKRINDLPDHLESYKEPVSLSKATIKLSKTLFTYDGAAKKPTVTVKYSGKTLQQGKDYTLSYVNADSLGTAAVIVRGAGNYTGKVKKTYTIRLATPAITLTAPKRGRILVRYQEVTGAVGYQIQFKPVGTDTFQTKNVKTLQKTLTDLTPGADYIVRVRAFTKIGQKMHYSAFSAEKQIAAGR